MAATRDFIGVGWRFPFQFDARTGGVARDQGSGTEQQLNRVRWSIQQIVRVTRGEMMLSRKFGSRLRELIFQLNTSNFDQRVQFAVTQALEDRVQGEKRAFIDRVNTIFEAASNKADISVDFVLRRSNMPGNAVFPHYLRESERGAAERGLGD